MCFPLGADWNVWVRTHAEPGSYGTSSLVTFVFLPAEDKTCWELPIGARWRENDYNNIVFDTTLPVGADTNVLSSARGALCGRLWKRRRNPRPAASATCPSIKGTTSTSRHAGLWWDLKQDLSLPESMPLRRSTSATT
jgi:hypothetical protein